MADLNFDCIVEFEDLMTFAQQWLEARDYPDLGLEAYWKMEDGPGGNVLSDSSPGNHPGTLINMDDNDWVAGKFSTGLDFNGVDDYVEFTGYKGITGSSPRTCTAWVRTTTIGVIMHWGVNVLGGRWTMVVDSGGHLRQEVGGGAIVGSTVVGDGKWHHVAAASDGGDIGTTILYVDGIRETLTTTASRTIDTQSAGDATIGTMSGSLCFAGVIDEVRIYARLLSPDEIARLGQPGGDLDGVGGVNMADFGLLSTEWMQQGKARVLINEIHSDPDVKTELVEFIELYNAGDISANLAEWYFSSGITFEFSSGVMIAPGQYLVLAQDAAGFNARFGFSPHGVYVGQLENDGETVRLRDAQDKTVDAVDYQLGFPWPTVGDPISEFQPGTGYSMQLINPGFDNDLGGNWRSAPPSPGRRNNAFAANSAPQMRQLKCSPKKPRSGEPVTITIKVTDDRGVRSVNLAYQIVDPGQYININDAQYETTWTSLPMFDDGTGGDVTAGDNVYTVVIPAGLQDHRRLMRYRITAEDNIGLSVRVPYADDQSPNFAYFVYDGVPAWTGAVRPGVDPLVTFGTDVMRSLPVYHLISKKSDIETATWRERYGGSDYKWWGTLVYDDKVYDHIRYRARGGVWRYAMGKNMWKFDFNRGRYFQARDDYGKKYKTKWDKLNFSACIQQGSFGQRGEQGMFEALSFKMFDVAGSPASKTNWLQYRIIDEAHEDGLFNAAHGALTGYQGTQYDGDFWGLYMTIEQMDGKFLEEHDLADGNLYKMESGTGTAGGSLNNQGPTQPTDNSDLVDFKTWGYETSPAQYWWVGTVNLDHYYPYYAVYQAVHHGDITSKNHFFYNNPEPVTNEWGTNLLWSQLVWDLDLTWTTYYGSNNPGDPWSKNGLLGYSDISIRNKNFTRHFNDLLFGTDQMYQLIDEFAAIIDPPGAPLSMVDTDQAMWDWHWVVSDAACSEYRNRCGNNKAGQDRFYKSAQNAGLERSFEGMVQLMKNYVSARRSHMEGLCADSAIPNKPSLSYAGTEGNPINDLKFSVSPFSDPQGQGTFAAMKWRIAEVAEGSQVVIPNDDDVLIARNSLWKYLKGNVGEPSNPVEAWRELNFDDGLWPEGQTSIGYGDNDDATILNDMRYTYSTVYLRRKFSVPDISKIGSLKLRVYVDDGCIIWINGTEIEPRFGVTSGFKAYNGFTGQGAVGNASWQEVTLAAPYPYLVEGDNANVMAIHVLNTILTSSDLSIDVELIIETGEEPPVTPPAYSRTRGKYEIETVWDSGEVSPFENSVQIPAIEVRSGRTYRVRVSMKDNTARWSHWSDPYQFVAGEPIAAGILEDLRITEVMYNPADPPVGSSYDNDDFEFVELKNVGDDPTPLDLSHVSFTSGIDFAFAGSPITSLAAGEFVLVVRNEAAFTSRYPGLADRIAGEYQFAPVSKDRKLDNGGETIRLKDTYNGTIAEFGYNDGRGWPISADGAGHSIIPLDSAIAGQSAGSCKYGGNWRASMYIHGSPGTDDPTPATGVVINEIMAHTDYDNPAKPEYDSNDWIELYNTTGSPVTFDGHWYLSDDADDLKKWAIPSGAIGAYARISFDEVSGFHNPITTGFGLNKAGEQVFLSYLPGTAVDRVVDYVKFKGQANFVSRGRLPDGGAYWFALTPTRDNPNAGAVVSVVINELMYHPADNKYEYVELYNPTNQTVNLYNSEGPWRLDGAVNYTFAASISIGPGQKMVVVPFDPENTPDLNAFVQDYQPAITLEADVNIFGPFGGNLSNGSERLSLEKREAPDLPDTDIPRVIVDEVIYGDYDPWPRSADGTGDALHRLSTDPAVSGNDPTNWQGATHSPGE